MYSRDLILSQQPGFFQPFYYSRLMHKLICLKITNLNNLNGLYCADMPLRNYTLTMCVLNDNKT